MLCTYEDGSHSPERKESGDAISGKHSTCHTHFAPCFTVEHLCPRNYRAFILLWWRTIAEGAWHLPAVPQISQEMRQCKASSSHVTFL